MDFITKTQMHIERKPAFSAPRQTDQWGEEPSFGQVFAEMA